jgi:hypothetical protein
MSTRKLKPGRIGPDVDLDQEEIYLADGRRLTQQLAEEIAERVLVRHRGRPSVSGGGRRTPSLTVRVPQPTRDALEKLAKSQRNGWPTSRRGPRRIHLLPRELIRQSVGAISGAVATRRSGARVAPDGKPRSGPGAIPSGAIPESAGSVRQLVGLQSRWSGSGSASLIWTTDTSQNATEPPLRTLERPSRICLRPEVVDRQGGPMTGNGGWSHVAGKTSGQVVIRTAPLRQRSRQVVGSGGIESWSRWAQRHATGRQEGCWPSATSI